MMSHRGKRQSSTRLDDVTPVATKRRKGRTTTLAEEEEASAMDQRHPYSGAASVSSDYKISSIYNRTVTDAPAELFRKDLISAMKLPDSEPLTSDHYWIITDQWKQEWERGVQVPVKPDSLPGPVVTVAGSSNNFRRMHHEFKLPKNKYIRITKDEHFRVDEHYLSNVGIQAEKCCSYDLEDVDVVWLNIQNGERALMGLPAINQEQLERVIEELEMRCWEKVHAIVKKEEGLALEFDESVICDVCRSPDSEDGNEMVFCDCCNICVHQACYGITSIPAGSWLCRTCALGLRPECVLCPNKNGAMKSTRSGQKWAHVSCALWIPEVSIGCVEKMEPITKISSIPQSRWALICVLCRERVGACIQCSVKTCKTAYHVTCAFKHGLEMRAIIDEESTTDDDNTVKLRSYCQKHSISSKKESNSVSGANSDEEVKKKQRKDMTTEEKTHARAMKLQEIEAEFEKHVGVKDINRKYDVDAEGLESIYNYWVLKRRASFNKPLLTAKSEDASDLVNKNQEQVDQEKMRMFVQLRQDLERVRNLCYMVSRREKLSRSYQRLREQTFYKQAALLSDTRINLSTAEITSIKEANHGPSIYDRLYSHPNALDLSTDFETMVMRIAGYSEGDQSPRRSVNGYVSSKRSCLNGDICSKSGSGFFESLSSSASDMENTKSHAGTESDTRFKVNNRMNKSQRKNNVENRTKNTARRRKSPSTYLDSTTTTENDDYDVDASNSKMKDRQIQRSKKSITGSKKQSPSARRSFDLLESRIIRSRSGSADDDEDYDSEEDLFIMRNKNKDSTFKKNAVSEIYSSDTDSSTSTKKSAPRKGGSVSKAAHDSRKPVRTKASVKEFSAADAHGGTKERNEFSKSFSASKSSIVDKRKRVKDLFDEMSDDATPSVKELSKSKGSSSENDIVPQRKAAKAASESISPSKSNKSRTKKEKVHKKTSPSSDVKKPLRKDPYNVDNEIHIMSKSAERDIGYHDTLALVPQRAAAKKAIKAIEHIKNGMVKPPTTFDETEKDQFKSSSKSAKATKKEHHSSLTKSKATDTEESKTEVKSFQSDKRYQKSSSGSSGLCTTSSSTNTSTHFAFSTSSTASGFVSSSVSSSSGTGTSVTNSTLTTSVSSALPGSVVSSTPAATAPTAATSSSGSSSGSSSSGSSSSSSSSGSSSSSSSSSSDSSSSGSSSSSSSDSEPEETPRTAKKQPSLEKLQVESTPVSISSSIPTSKPMPKSKKRELEISLNDKNERRTHETTTAEIHRTKDIKKPSPLSAKDALVASRKSASPLPQKDIVSEENAAAAAAAAAETAAAVAEIDNSVSETKSAIEHLTNNEQNFLLSPPCWAPETSVANLHPMTVQDKVKLESRPDEQASSLLSSLPNRSLFSPQLIKDIDLSTFDVDNDDLSEHNNLNDSTALSLASLAALSFGNDFSFKEDSKEDSARETLNLVEKLRLELERKKTGTGEGADSISSAPTPDIPINHVSEDEERLEEDNADQQHLGSEKRAESVEPAQLPASMMPLIAPNDQPLANEGEVNNLPNLQLPTAVTPRSTSDMYNVCSFPTENISVMEKERVPVNEGAPMAPWPRSNHTYNDPDAASPYTQDDSNSINRWSENVMIPSRRSDCSSTSTSSGSSSSSTYSELPHHEPDIAAPNDVIPTLEISQHIPKSVADLLRPVTTNDSGFPSNIPENVYSYGEHLSPFVSNKSLYPHDPHQLGTQASSLFSSSMAFDGISSYDPNMSKPFGPLMIQPPCAAAASFTTTSQNMAFTTSIISPVPSLNTDDVTVTDGGNLSTPTTDESTKLDTPTSQPAATEEKEKDNSIFESTIDLISSIRSCVEKPPEEKPEPKTPVVEPAPVCTPILDTVTSTPALPKLPTPTSTSNKKSPVKPTRVSARVMSQNKSPAGKSPMMSGVSPARIVEPTPPAKGKGTGRKNHRANNKGTGTRSSRGRGRGRGRNCFYRDWDGDTITSKLQGTVYDFDDEDEKTEDNFENLRAMRERRKSTDTAYCDKLSTSSKDTCYSPKFASPSSQQSQSKRKTPAATPDRRSSHRTQLSPLCEISNNGRVITKDLYRDSVDDEEEDDQVEEEEEDTVIGGSDKRTTVCASKSDRASVGSTSSPTLPQPPIQSAAVEHFAAVQPLLPGPVDMRTYSDALYEAQTVRSGNLYDSTLSNENNTLRSTVCPATSSTSEPMPDIVDALEKEIERYSANQQPNVAVNRSTVKHSPAAAAFTDTTKQSDVRSATGNTTSTSPSQFLMMSESMHNVHRESSTSLLEDESQVCRNQLKVKIKGPYSDANYVPVMVPSATSAQQLPSVNNSSFITSTEYSSTTATLNVSGVGVSMSVTSSSSYNRRMRKKELLRQYCTQQDTNMDECGNDMPVPTPNPSSGTSEVIVPPTSTPIKSAPSYKLPKAVASMTTIPTKEDYKDAAAYMEKKKRGKDKIAVSTETTEFAGTGNSYANINNTFNNIFNNKQNIVPSLGPTMAYHADVGNDMSGISDNHVTKRKSRGASTSTSTHPKLKIKIGGIPSAVLDTGLSSASFEEKNLRLRPPKKRPCGPADMLPSPATVEQLKRESMRYRSKVISEFNENGRRYEPAGEEEFSDNDNGNGGLNTIIAPAKETSTSSTKKRRKRSSSNTSYSQKSAKRKKKQEQKSRAAAGNANDDESSHVRVITNHKLVEGAPMKLIIKFGGPNSSSAAESKSETSSTDSVTAAATAAGSLPASATKPPKSSKRNMNHELDSVRTTKITPIRLKLSRSKEGYVTKPSSVNEDVAGSASSGAPMLPKNVSDVPVAETTVATSSQNDAATTTANSAEVASVVADCTSNTTVL